MGGVAPQATVNLLRHSHAAKLDIARHRHTHRDYLACACHSLAVAIAPEAKLARVSTT
jgi:hypothetical protein